MSRSTVQCILLTQKAEVKTVKVPYTSVLTLENVQQVLKKKELPQLLGTYAYKSNLLTLLGYTKGKEGAENKHELPPPLDSSQYFGDILLVASTAPANYSKPIAFKPEEYEAFYTKMFGGFDDEDEDEEEEEEEVEEEEVKEKTIEEDEEEEDEEVEEEEEVGMAEFEAAEEEVVPES